MKKARKPDKINVFGLAGDSETRTHDPLNAIGPLEHLAFCKFTWLLAGPKNGLFISKTDICKFRCSEYLQHLFVSGVTFL